MRCMGARGKARRNSAALLLAGILGDAIVECLNFGIESYKRSLTRDAVLANAASLRAVTASTKCLM